MNRKAFDKALIKEYGYQVWRDNRRNKNGLDACADCSTEVVAACGLIKEKDKARFKAAILKYVRTHKKPTGFF